MGRRDDDLQPAGVTHESAIGVLLGGSGLDGRHRATLRPGFRKEAFVPVAFGAVETWARQNVLLAEIQERLESLGQVEGASWLEVRWGEDGWWKRLHGQERGEQGLRLRIGNEKTVDLVEHQVMSVGAIKDGGFKVMGAGSVIILEAKAMVDLKRNRGGRIRVEQVDARQAREARKEFMVNDVRVEWRTLGSKLDEYLCEFQDRHVEPLQALYIASRGGDVSYFEAVAIAARIEALIAWLGVPGREDLKRLELGNGMVVSPSGLMRAAARATLYSEADGLRFRAREVLDLVEEDVEEMEDGSYRNRGSRRRRQP
jgi:hypothetical protein